MLSRQQILSYVCPASVRTFSPWVRSLLLLLAGIILVHCAFLKPAIWGLDGNEVLRVAHALVTRGSFSIDADVGGMVGVDGQSYSTRYLLLPVLLTPLVAIATMLSQYISLPVLQLSALLAVGSSVFFTAATAVMVALLAVRLGAKKENAYLSAICYAFGTIALTYAQTLFSEPLLGLLIVLCVYFAFGKTRKEWIASSLLVILAILAKPTGIVIAPVLSLYFLFKRRSWLAALGPVLLPTVGVAGYALYNYLRFGGLLETGQPLHYAWRVPGFAERFFGFLFGIGMGGGLFWYCPPVILAGVGFYKLWKRLPLEALSIGAISLSFVWLHANWWCCGWDWGPRFLVPVLPLLLALTALLDYSARRWLIVLSTAGFLISAPTLFSFYQRYYWEVDTAGKDVWALSLWTRFTTAPLFNVWSAAFRQISVAMTTDVSRVVATGELSGLTQIVPVWWWMLPVFAVPVWPGFLVAVMLLLLGIYCIVAGAQQLSLTEAISSRGLSSFEVLRGKTIEK